MRSWLAAAVLLTAACAATTPKPKAAAAGPHRGFYAVLTTPRGTVEALLFQDEAPKTVENFRVRASSGAFDGRPLLRAVPGFLVQAGAAAGGAPLPLETNPIRDFAKAGRLAAPALDGGADPSQFFVTLAPAPWLDGKNTVFGEVTAGLDLLREASAGPREERDAKGRLADTPAGGLAITSVRIEDRR